MPTTGGKIEVLNHSLFSRHQKLIKRLTPNQEKERLPNVVGTVWPSTWVLQLTVSEQHPTPPPAAELEGPAEAEAAAESAAPGLGGPSAAPPAGSPATRGPSRPQSAGAPPPAAAKALNLLLKCPPKKSH